VGNPERPLTLSLLKAADFRGFFFSGKKIQILAELHAHSMQQPSLWD